MVYQAEYPGQGGVRGGTEGNHESVPEKEEFVEADSVILAVGQTPDLTFLKPEDGVEITPGGLVKIDPETMATTASGVFAGGDAAFGPRTVIEAVWHAKRAALSIEQFFRGGEPKRQMSISIEDISQRAYTMPLQYEKIDRKQPPQLDLERRTGISEVELSYSEEEAMEQAERCLVCHVETIYDSKKCIVCGRCVDICPYHCWKLVPLEQLEIDEEEIAATYRTLGYKPGDVVTAMIKDDERCIRCGLCALRCPTGAISMERFSFNEKEDIVKKETGDGL
jgi:ferredoxin